MAGESSPLMGGRERRRNVRPALVVAAACLAVVACLALIRSSQSAGGRSVLKALNPGLRSGADKLPDDPWGYKTPSCRGLATCSSSTSSPAIKRHQNALAKGVLPAGGNKAAVQHQTTAMAQKAVATPAAQAQSKDLSMTQQYARIIEQQGYFAPWSRQNLWNNRLAIDNIRKNNTPQALAAKEAQIKAEDLKFHKAFDTPHTAQYTGMHESLATILDPKYQPWANQAPRKAYYSGF